MLISVILLAVLCSICTSLGSGKEVPPPYDQFDKRGIYYKLPELQFGVGELEPFIDSTTVQAHHGFHHRVYVDNVNPVLKQWRTELPQDVLAISGSLLDMIKNPEQIPEKFRKTIKTQGGGFLNHCIYWAALSGNPSGKDRHPTGKLLQDINAAFGSFDKFKESFVTTAKGLSPGFIWLSRDKKDQLAISTTQGGDSPAVQGHYPLLVIDMAEHAYYLRHQYRRLNYINDWWKLIDWQKVAKLDMWWANLSQNSTVSKDEL